MLSFTLSYFICVCTGPLLTSITIPRGVRRDIYTYVYTFFPTEELLIICYTSIYKLMYFSTFNSSLLRVNCD